MKAATPSSWQFERWRWQIFLVTWLAYAGFYLTRKSFAVAKVVLSDPAGMGWSKIELAWVDGAYLTSYAAGQFIWGVCGDKFGTRRVVLAGMMVSVVTATLMGASSLVVLFGMLFCIQGLCQSTGWAPLAKNIGEFFSHRERGWVMGFWCTNYALGGFFAAWLAGFAIDSVGHQRLLEYKPDQPPAVEMVVEVAQSQGRDEQTALTIYGFLRLAEATRQPTDQVGKSLDAVFEDEQVNGPVRVAVLEALFSLQDPRFKQTRESALQSDDPMLVGTVKRLDKKAEKLELDRLAGKASPEPATSEQMKKSLAQIRQKTYGRIEGILGWRFAFWVPAVVLAGVWLLFLILQRNRPEDVGLSSIEKYHGEKPAVLEPGETPDEEPEGSWKVIGEVLTNKMVLLLAAVYFFLKPTRYMVLFCSPMYVNERLGTGAGESGILGSMFDLAGPVGVLFGGFMSDFVFRSKRIPMSVLGLVGVAILMFCFSSLPDTPLAMGLGFFGIGFLLYIPDSLVSGTAAIDFGTKKGASTAAGVINGCGSVGAIIGGTLPGWMEAILGEGEYVWNYIFVGLGVSLLVAAILLLPQWNTVPATANNSQNGGQ